MIYKNGFWHYKNIKARTILDLYKLHQAYQDAKRGYTFNSKNK